MKRIFTRLNRIISEPKMLKGKLKGFYPNQVYSILTARSLVKEDFKTNAGGEMRTFINKLKRDNIRFYIKFITELGLLRKRNECALCFKQIDIKDYNIQLCRNCRMKQLDIINEEQMLVEK